MLATLLNTNALEILFPKIQFRVQVRDDDRFIIYKLRQEAYVSRQLANGLAFAL